jgi:hypothetical protein
VSVCSASVGEGLLMESGSVGWDRIM